MRVLATILLILLMPSFVRAQDCISHTGTKATVVLPEGTVEGVEEGEVIKAWFEDLCVGQTVYHENASGYLTIWGDEQLTPLVDGLPEDAPVTFSVYRPATDKLVGYAVVSYLQGDGTFVPRSVMVFSSFSLDWGLPVPLNTDLPLTGGRIQDSEGNQIVVLHWKLKDGALPRHYEVQHRPAGDSTFVSLDTVTDGTHQADSTTYQYQIDHLPPGTHTFRLKQGATRYSASLKVTLSPAPLPPFSLSQSYPNPFSETTRLTLVTPKAEWVDARLYNLQGRLIQTLYQGLTTPGLPLTLTLQAQGLANGLYLLHLQGESFSEIRKLTLVK